MGLEVDHGFRHALHPRFGSRPLILGPPLGVCLRGLEPLHPSLESLQLHLGGRGFLSTGGGGFLGGGGFVASCRCCRLCRRRFGCVLGRRFARHPGRRRLLDRVSRVSHSTDKARLELPAELARPLTLGLLERLLERLEVLSQLEQPRLGTRLRALLTRLHRITMSCRTARCGRAHRRGSLRRDGRGRPHRRLIRRLRRSLEAGLLDGLGA